MNLICQTLAVSRGHLRKSLQNQAPLPKKRRGALPLLSDEELVERIRSLIAKRPTYGYRRACAVLNRALHAEGLPPANHKRIYRLMKEAGFLLPKCVGYQPKRKHEGTVQTLRSQYKVVLRFVSAPLLGRSENRSHFCSGHLRSGGPQPRGGHWQPGGL